MAHPLSTLLTAIISIATTIIAGCALVLTFRSWRDNRDKLRLDLFDRRFSIYQRTLAFYQELIVWKDQPEQKALVQPFIEASREALFIFPRKSGVYDFLQEFWYHAYKVARFTETMEPLRKVAMYEESTRELIGKVSQERVDDVNWILESLPRLEKLMGKSMSFERL